MKFWMRLLGAVRAAEAYGEQGREEKRARTFTKKSPPPATLNTPNPHLNIVTIPSPTYPPRSRDPRLPARKASLYLRRPAARPHRASTEYLFWPELWVPIQNEEQIEGYGWLDKRQDNNSWDIGRLKPGVTAAQANADLARIAAQLAKENPGVDQHLALKVTQPGFLGDALSGPYMRFYTG